MGRGKRLRSIKAVRPWCGEMRHQRRRDLVQVPTMCSSGELLLLCPQALSAGFHEGHPSCRSSEHTEEPLKQDVLTEVQRPADPHAL